MWIHLAIELPLQQEVPINILARLHQSQPLFLNLRRIVLLACCIRAFSMPTINFNIYM
jgi:hypothetical protein